MLFQFAFSIANANPDRLKSHQTELAEYLACQSLILSSNKYVDRAIGDMAVRKYGLQPADCPAWYVAENTTLHTLYEAPIETEILRNYSLEGVPHSDTVNINPYTGNLEDALLVGSIPHFNMIGAKPSMFVDLLILNIQRSRDGRSSHTSGLCGAAVAPPIHKDDTMLYMLTDNTITPFGTQTHHRKHKENLERHLTFRAEKSYSNTI